jgi:hypothetical protein
LYSDFQQLLLSINPLSQGFKKKSSHFIFQNVFRKISTLCWTFFCHLRIDDVVRVGNLLTCKNIFGHIQLVQFPTFYWNVRIKTGKWAVTYLCVNDIDFASFRAFFYWILELFRQCCIFFSFFFRNKRMLNVFLIAYINMAPVVPLHGDLWLYLHKIRPVFGGAMLLIFLVLRGFFWGGGLIVFVLCNQCCKNLCIVHSWLPLQFYLTFIWKWVISGSIFVAKKIVSQRLIYWWQIIYNLCDRNLQKRKCFPYLTKKK